MTDPRPTIGEQQGRNDYTTSSDVPSAAFTSAKAEDSRASGLSSTAKVVCFVVEQDTQVERRGM